MGGRERPDNQPDSALRKQRERPLGVVLWFQTHGGRDLPHSHRKTTAFSFYIRIILFCQSIGTPCSHPQVHSIHSISKMTHFLLFHHLLLACHFFPRIMQQSINCSNFSFQCSLQTGCQNNLCKAQMLLKFP